MERPSLRHLAVAVVAVIPHLFAVTASAQGHRGQAGDVPSFLAPVRTSQSAGPVTPPPDLPAAAQTVTPSTLEIATAAAPDGAAVVHSVTRTIDRLHIDTGSGREWLYLRNPVDPRRVSALLTDHASRTIVVYDESDLRNTMGLRGWLDVLALGFDPGSLDQLERQNEERQAFSLAFQRFTARLADAVVREAWWNPSELLPLQVTRRRMQGEPVVVTVRQWRAAIDRERLVLPSERFPAYRQLELADWLEGLHER